MTEEENERLGERKPLEADEQLGEGERQQDDNLREQLQEQNDERQQEKNDRETSGEQPEPPPPNEPEPVTPPYEYDRPVTIQKTDPTDDGDTFEILIRQRHQNLPYSDRVYIPGPDSPNGKRIADDFTFVNGQKTAVEAKYVEDWSESIFNPAICRGLPFAEKIRAGIITQIRDYCTKFRGGTIIYTNSVEFADYYTKLLHDAGVTNFRFVIVPVEYK